MSGFIMVTMFADSVFTNWTRITLTTQWAAIGAAVPLYVSAYAFFKSRAHNSEWLVKSGQLLRMALACAYVSCGVWLAIFGHRFYVLAFVLVQALTTYQFLRRSGTPAARSLSIGAAAFVSWTAGAAVTYTALDNFMFSGAASSSFAAVALVLTFGLALSRLLDVDFSVRTLRPKARLIATFVVCAAYTELALRTDGLLTDWIPYHRSYFTEPATFVRLGHWLLWDVPSQYGFFSILAVALAPGATTWQSLYILTAVFLVIQSVMLFMMFTKSGSGPLAFLYSALVPAAVFLTEQGYRWPFGPRAYPQGGVRFFWLYIIMFVVFQLSGAFTGKVRARCIYLAIGHLTWLLGCLWSFESAAWISLVWGTYLCFDCFLRAATVYSWRARITSFAPVLLLPVIAIVCVVGIDAYYVIRLGHAPDWLGYVEFCSIYLGTSPEAFPVDRLGSGWFLLVALGGIGTPMLVAISNKQYRALPALAASWMAVWGTCLYFAGETWANHVNALLGILAFAFATIALVSKRHGLTSAPIILSQSTFLPVSVLLLSGWFANVGALSKTHAPFFHDYHFDQTSQVRPISGELAALMTRAGIEPSDKVVLPYAEGWVKLDVGLYMPFVLDAQKQIRELYPWLPLAPGGAFGIYDTLPPDRQHVYVDRFLRLTRKAGWLITYHEPPLCAVYSPDTYGSGLWKSENYSVTKCVFRQSSDQRALVKSQR